MESRWLCVIIRENGGVLVKKAFEEEVMEQVNQMAMNYPVIYSALFIFARD